MNNKKDEQQRLQKTLLNKKTDRQSYLIFMPNRTIQSHSRKVFRTVKYCVSNFFFQQTANSSAIVKY